MEEKKRECRKRGKRGMERRKKLIPPSIKRWASPKGEERWIKKYGSTKRTKGEKTLQDISMTILGHYKRLDCNPRRGVD